MNKKKSESTKRWHAVPENHAAYLEHQKRATAASQARPFEEKSLAAKRRERRRRELAEMRKES